MKKSKNTRREFLKVSSAAVTGTAISAAGSARAADDTSKILNYNPKMGYRRLGKTGVMISEVSLGGHGATGDRVANRTAVLERAVELGMNYVDNNISGECDLYGKAMAASTTAKRDKWFIGFASWPQKITAEYEDQLTTAGMMKSIEDRLKSYQTDVLDMWRPVGATWGKGQTVMATMLMVNKKALDMVVEVFEKAKKQGKVRHLGVSAHNPKVFRRVLGEYPQFSVIIFPLPFPDQGVRRRQPLEAGPGKGRRRDRVEAVRRRDDLRAEAAADQGPRRPAGACAGQGDAAGAAASRPSYRA